jgi:hypothetical protein
MVFWCEIKAMSVFWRGMHLKSVLCFKLFVNSFEKIVFWFQKQKNVFKTVTK